MKDPHFMETVLNNDPTLNQLAQSNPQVKEMLSNPQLLGSMMTPENMAMAQNMMSMMGQQPGYALGGNPGSFPMPGNPNQTTPELQPPLPNNPTTQPRINFPPMPMFNPFMFQNLMQPQPNLGINPVINQSIDYKVLYKDQLNQMKDMGFINEETNLEALKMTHGNVNAAVENLLSMFK